MPMDLWPLVENAKDCGKFNCGEAHTCYTPGYRDRQVGLHRVWIIGDRLFYCMDHIGIRQLIWSGVQSHFNTPCGFARQAHPSAIACTSTGRCSAMETFAAAPMSTA